MVVFFYFSFPILTFHVNRMNDGYRERFFSERIHLFVCMIGYAESDNFHLFNPKQNMRLILSYIILRKWHGCNGHMTWPRSRIDFNRCQNIRFGRNFLRQSWQTLNAIKPLPTVRRSDERK